MYNTSFAVWPTFVIIILRYETMKPLNLKKYWDRESVILLTTFKNALDFIFSTWVVFNNSAWVGEKHKIISVRRTSTFGRDMRMCGRLFANDHNIETKEMKLIYYQHIRVLIINIFSSYLCTYWGYRVTRPLHAQRESWRPTRCNVSSLYSEILKRFIKMSKYRWM